MSFFSRSLLLLFLLYGAVFALGDVALLHNQAPIWTGFVFVLVIVGLQYILGPWIVRLVYSIDWDEQQIPAVHRAFVERMCREHNLPQLPMGIIESGTPNAFAFGRVRSDARIVVTRGLLDICTEDEVNAVLAHEIGHVAHYDFAVMALAAAAPLLLWQIYVWTDRISNLRIVSYGAYVAYWVSQYLVLMLNRMREYGADHFSAQATHAPNLLASALVKIGYGLVQQQGEAARLVSMGDKDEKKSGRQQIQFGRALSLMGIMGAAGTQALALATSPEDAARVMRWDLTNPWARFYELSSTHPLTAFRLRALNRQAMAQGQNAEYPLPENTRVRWAGFPVEFFFWGAPLACGFLLISDLWIGARLEHLGYSLPAGFDSWLLVIGGITWAARIAYRYRGKFGLATVRELLEDLTVSQMRPRAVQISGEIVGQGVPGAFWCPDLVLRDDTGMVYMLYRSSIPFARFLFAVRNVDRLIGERVTLQGWYRRGLRPYIEMSRIEAQLPVYKPGDGPLRITDSSSTSEPDQMERFVRRSYSRWIQTAGAALCTAIGLIGLLASL